MRGAPREVNPDLLFVLYFFTKWLPMFVSALAIYLGYRLFILGVTGQASISVDAHSVKGQLINAAPGLFFAVGGIVTLIFAILKGLSIDFGGGGGGKASGRARKLQQLQANVLSHLSTSIAGEQDR